MKIIYAVQFKKELAEITEFIRKDKRSAAIKFRTELRLKIENQYILGMRVIEILFTKDIQLFTKSTSMNFEF